MRKIAFRSWLKDKKEMLYDFGTLDNNCLSDDYRATITQFTGLFDKHGAPVFEGDILRMGLWLYNEERHRDVVGEVFYDEYYLCFMLVTKDLPVGYNTLAFYDNGDYEILDVEVIGNIFENPKLLEG